MNIVYFVIGDSAVIHIQVGFSIRTILSQTSEEDTVYVVTDTPTMYCNLPHVVTIPITQERIKEWRGKHDFFWRVKIKVLQQIAQMSHGHMSFPGSSVGRESTCNAGDPYSIPG